MRIILPFYQKDLEVVKQIVRERFQCGGESPYENSEGYTAYHFQVLVEHPTVDGEKLMIEIQGTVYMKVIFYSTPERVLNTLFISFH